MTPAEVIAPLPRLRGWAVRLVGLDAADDLLQDAAERAIRHCGRADPAHLRGWLMAIMRNRALHLHRDEAADRRRLAAWRGGPLVTEPAAEHVVLLREVEIWATPAERRALLHLVDHDGRLTGTEKCQVHRARRRLTLVMDLA